MKSVLQRNLDKIEKMNREDLTLFLDGLRKYSIGTIQKELVEACEAKLARPSIGDAIVENGDISDFGGN